jgi:hypothetical protein
VGRHRHGAPIYIAETAPAHLRGALISLKEVFIVGGILLVGHSLPLHPSHQQHVQPATL